MDLSPQFDKYHKQANSLGALMTSPKNSLLYNHPVLGYKARRDNVSDAVENGTRYHGTNETFQPGDTLTSSASRGVEPKFGGGSVLNDGKGSEHYTYSTASPSNAQSYAKRATKSHGGTPSVYEVKHEGFLHADPESPRSATRSTTGNMKVIRRVPDEEVASLPSNPRYSRWE